MQRSQGQCATDGSAGPDAGTPTLPLLLPDDARRRRSAANFYGVNQAPVRSEFSGCGGKVDGMSKTWRRRLAAGLMVGLVSVLGACTSDEETVEATDTEAVGADMGGATAPAGDAGGMGAASPTESAPGELPPPPGWSPE